MGDESVGIRVKGLTLTGLSNRQRSKAFSEWAAEFCDYYPSIEAAAADLPFTFYLPESPLTGPVTAVYVSKANPFPEHRTVTLHFAKGVNGLSLSICRNLDAEQSAGSNRRSCRKYSVFNPSGNSSPNRLAGLARLRRIPGKCPFPWEFKANAQRVKVLDLFESTPEALLWSCQGLFYTLCNGWGDNAYSIDELKEIVRYWLNPIVQQNQRHRHPPVPGR